VHFWQRGRFLPQAQLATIADRRGCGRITDIRAWRATTRNGVNYGVKMAGVSYGLKMTEADESQRGYLLANGGRLVHASRDFWRDRDGQRCGQRDAMRSWEALQHDDDSRWVLVREDPS
jgi:hypothetical protein